jgi:hypothetical protein
MVEYIHNNGTKTIIKMTPVATQNNTFLLFILSLQLDSSFGCSQSQHQIPEQDSTDNNGQKQRNHCQRRANPYIKVAKRNSKHEVI